MSTITQTKLGRAIFGKATLIAGRDPSFRGNYRRTIVGYKELVPRMVCRHGRLVSLGQRVRCCLKKRRGKKWKPTR